MSSDQMSKVDMTKDAVKINQFQLDLMKKVQRQNWERALKLQKVKSKNNRTLGLIGLICGGIYVATLFNVRQETFLDDFNVPESIPLDPYTHKE